MATKVLPFYPMAHTKHVSHTYHGTQSKSVVKEHTSSRKVTSKAVSHKQAQATEAMVEPAYTVPAFRQRNPDDVEEYQRVATNFGKNLASIQQELHMMKMATRLQVENIAITKEVQEMMTVKRYIAEEIGRAPYFLVCLRSHTVWEKTPVKLFCTLEGHPNPIVKWFKGGVPVDPLSAPGKYKIESKYGVHSLIISRCVVSDTAEYSAVATNAHGSVTSKCAVIVKRAAGAGEPYLLPGQVPMLSNIHRSKLEVSLLDRFGVSFGTEGESISLVCTMVVVPDLPNLPPEAMWYRDDKLLKAGEWAEMTVGGGGASLTLPHLSKDDEGLYTLRIWTKDGTAEHSAYLFVKDAVPNVPGAPGAPMSVKVCDVNKDYVLLSWKPPNVTTEAPTTGYFVDRCEVGKKDWVQCNDAPVKICKYPVHGLSEGHAYYFRVRAVNSAGISRASRVSEKVVAHEPTDSERVQVIKLGGRQDIVIKADDLEGYITLPGPPTEVHASEIFKSYIVLSWKPPTPRGRSPLWYTIEKSVADTGAWQRVDTVVRLCSPRYPMFDLEEGKRYRFRVTAVNANGPGPVSEPSEPVQRVDAHGVPSAPGKVVATKNSRKSVFLQWEPPKNPNNLIGYYIDGCLQGSKQWFPCNHKPYKHTRFVVHGLTPGDRYMFRVQAVNVFGLSEESQESAAILVEPALATPGAPYGIALLSCDGSSMTLGWKGPKHSGGSKVNCYYLDRRETDSLTWGEVNVPPATKRIYTVTNLKEGSFYEFKIQAGNLAGVGVPSEPSIPFKCEAWTMAEPGPAYDLSFCEVKGNSLVLLWKAPVYVGQGPVTGYYVDMARKGSADWVTVNKEVIVHRYHKVCGLEEGASYVFRVRAVNPAGVGRASEISDAVCAKALPGAKEICCGVDEETGDIYLAFEACEISELSNFLWSKGYNAIGESSKFTVVSEGKHAKLIFKNPEKEDVGLFSVYVTETDGVSSSHSVSEEDLQKMLELSHAIRHPIVPLKQGLTYEVLEKGHVRFWLQTAKMSSAVSYRFIFNDKEVTSSESQKISHNLSTGVIQMVLDSFTRSNEGTYTVQINDGKAKNQSSLVLVGDAFRAALKEAEFQKKEHIRKQGPHFKEYLSFHVDEDCTVMLVCKVANVKKETAFHWYKEDEEIVLDVAPNVMSGTCVLPIPMFSRKDQGIYKATLSDDRGKDTSVYDISGKVFDDIINDLARIAGSSASELVLQCTPEGIRLQCYMKYYTEEMKTHWFHKESKISSSEKMRIGGTAEMAWMQICEPSDREKGQYSINIMDASKAHTRSFDLSGQAYTEAYEEYQRLKAAAFAEKNRGRVVGGLPDVVTIMEKKTLSLTCTVWGDPSPEVTWFKNDQEVVSDAHNKITFEGGKFSSLTINTVTADDSGKYSINVRNKYGGEFVEITVSVYRPGEDVPEPKLGQTSKAAAAAPAPATAPAPKSQAPPAGKSQAPPSSSKSPTPSSKTPTPPRSVKSPTPPRSFKSPTPPRK